MASYILSWQLWQPRADPPNLPAVGGLASFSFAIPLVATAVLAIRFPRTGAIAHGALLALAMLGDQIRLLPWFFSLELLLAAGAWPRMGFQIARWHLITLWGWAGLNKILSGGWSTGAAAFIADAMGSDAFRIPVAVLVPVIEVGFAVLGLWRRSWGVLRVAGPLFHIGIVVVLIMADWNTAVYPWNLALAAAVPLLFRVPDGAEERRGRIPKLAAAFLVLYPIGFYAGLVDTYLAHNLYTSNTANASLCTSAAVGAICDPTPLLTWDSLNVPIPPEKRLLVRWFDEICAPGQILRVDGRWTRFSDREVDFTPCPGGVSTAR
ncbi:MAG: hypothetical protein ABR540_04880 [Acidimicrobiales bacterium]